ncbi:biotin--[acetyl-CoA-carboxylase] ligase [Pseudorhodoferax sp. Leaf274]|uniref:biotin--[acetyl-CoA-carboxylase] ligase n=1 Tax=Pseudorhodoferax sp. Leaf274 TaxID=1736318 RepID=UPI000703A4D7|nr:biotin--[acetyl-CoA-carboxylase] ligase [Pseudorhodoferax sp. Leaf274]KQP47621.1 biotin--acetyl-CoA-carboxylase ligase [Pseudorhodoferax sp. Leaf274]
MLRWPAEDIWEAVAPGLPGFTVEVLPQVDSTSNELMRRIRAGRPEPTLLVAERQTAGRGRMGRPWQAEVGSSLAVSLALPLAPADWSGLSLAVGVAVAGALHPALRLKWPNDLWFDDRKLGGILIETVAASGVRHAIIGIGLNIAARPAEGLSTPPAALAELQPGWDAGQALRALALPLVQAVQRFEAEGFAPFRAAFEARDLLQGRLLRLSDGTEGVGDGVDPDGALRVQTAAGLQRISSSEVSVRPVKA